MYRQQSPPITFLFPYSQRLGMLDKLRTKYNIISIDVEEDGTTMRIIGAPPNVAAAVNDIKNMSVDASTKELSPGEASLIVGKGGSVVNALTDKHGVAIKITRGKDGSSSVLEIDGPTDACNAALVEIESILYDNGVFEELISVLPMHRHKLLLNSGEGIKAICADINREMGLAKDTVRLAFVEVSAGPSKSSIANAPSKLKVKATRANIARAKLLVQQRIDEYVDECMTLTVPLHVIPQIIGRGGATVQKLRSEGAGGDIEVDKATGVINIMADDAASRRKIKAAVEDIVARNQTMEIPVEKAIIGAILGGPGKEMMKKVIASGGSLTINSSDTHVVLRGTREQVDVCANLVKNFIESNYIEDLIIPPDDLNLLFQGDNALVRQIEKDHNVTTILKKGRQVYLYVRGNQEDVQAAMRRVKQVLVGGDGFAVSKLPVPNGVVGSIVGKGGKNIKALESENHGVTIQIDKDSAGLSIRGPKEMVARVRSSIIATIASAKVVELFPISADQRKRINTPIAIRNIAASSSTEMTLDGSSVRIRGARSDVKEAISLLEEHLTGKYKAYIELDSTQLAKVRSATAKDPSHFERIRTTTNTEVELDDSANAICIIGKRSNVKRAKGFVLGVLGPILPFQLERIKVSKPLIKPVCDPESLTKIASDSGASVSFDRDLSSIIIRSSNPEMVLKASQLVDCRSAECEKLNYVQKFSPSEAWILPNITRGSTMQMLERDSGCSIEVSMEDSTIVISGNDESKVESAKTKVNDIIDRARRQCVFVDIPESTMPAFIGKSGAHIKTLRENHNVDIVRLSKEPTRVKIQGIESNVASAKAAVDEWLMRWEAQHVGETITVEKGVIPAILGDKGSVSSIATYILI